MVFDDAVTQAVIVQAYGGWVKLCADCGTEEPEKWFQAILPESGQPTVGRECNGTGTCRAGLNSVNGSKGCLNDIPPPVFIGNPDKAHAVLEAGKSISLVTNLVHSKAIPFSAQEGI